MNRVLVPVLLDLTGLTILFVGAGEGTRVKLASLAPQKPSVRIVSPRIGADVIALTGGLDAEVRERPFSESDLDGVSLVFCMTDDLGVNARVADLCRARGLWCNAAGNRGPGSFTNPAVGRKEGIVAAFSSEASSPAASVAARDAWLGGR